MPSSYNNALRLEMIGTGEQAGIWGDTTNNNLGTLLVDAVAGYTSVSITSANQALTVVDGLEDQSRNAMIALTTTTTANFNVYVPPSSKLYTFYNASSYTATIYNSTSAGNTSAAGTGVAIPAGKTISVWSEGTNVAQQNTHLISPTVAGGTLTSPTLVAPALGTPTSGTLTNCTGLPVSTGVSGLGSGIATFLATPSSANLAAAVSDETGTGALVFANSPTLVTPALGTPSSGVMTNVTGLPLTSGVTGILPVANGGSGVSTSTGTGNNVLSNSPTLVTPVLGTPSSATLTNATGLPIDGGTTGTLPVARGGTAATTAAGARSSLDVPSTSGSGASGTWGINISGNAATASNPAAGGSFITSSNIGSQSVNYASSAGSASVASSANSVAWGNVSSKPTLGTLVGSYNTGYLGDGANGSRTYDIPYSSVGFFGVPMIKVAYDYWVYYNAGYGCQFYISSAQAAWNGDNILRVVMQINGAGQRWPYNFYFYFYV